MKKVILAVLALAPALAFATPGAYVSAQAGINYVDSGNSNLNNSSLTGPSGGIGIGYLWGDSSWGYGLEADGLSYPNSTTSTFKVNGYNISLLGVLK